MAGAEVNTSTNCCPSPALSTSWIVAFLDFERLYRFHRRQLLRDPCKSTSGPTALLDPVDRQTGVICDQTVVLLALLASSFEARCGASSFKDPETAKTLIFLTNNFVLPAFTITELYRCRWQVELFFKWIKQHLRIKAFFGTSETRSGHKSGSPSPLRLVATS